MSPCLSPRQLTRDWKCWLQFYTRATQPAPARVSWYLLCVPHGHRGGSAASPRLCGSPANDHLRPCCCSRLVLCRPGCPSIHPMASCAHIYSVAPHPPSQDPSRLLCFFCARDRRWHWRKRWRPPLSLVAQLLSNHVRKRERRLDWRTGLARVVCGGLSSTCPALTRSLVHSIPCPSLPVLTAHIHTHLLCTLPPQPSHVPCRTPAACHTYLAEIVAIGV